MTNPHTKVAPHRPWGATQEESRPGTASATSLPGSTPTSTARIINVRHGQDGVRTLTVACPYCGRRHRHGWPPEDKTPGIRLSHCRPTRRHPELAARPYLIEEGTAHV